MSTLEAIYFPGTTIYSASQFPVFLLLEKVHLLRPVETAGDSADIFVSSGLCQEYTPCPLGDSRDRFLRLIKDIRERKDDYAAQLSALTIASLSAQQASTDDTSRGIINSLLNTHGLTPASATKQDELLWQARLVLKIAEILDQEEEEVAVRLALLDDQQESLFKDLQGEWDEDEESLMDEIRQMRQIMSRPAAAAVKNRLNAWSRLYAVAEEPNLPLWLTDLDEAADILLEKYENTVKSPPPVIGKLELPANIGWSATDAIAHISRYRQATAQLREEITAAIHQGQTEQLALLAPRWARELDDLYPGDQFGRTTLTIYRLAATTCSSLLGKTTAHSGSMLAVIQVQA